MELETLMSETFADAQSRVNAVTVSGSGTILLFDEANAFLVQNVGGISARFLCIADIRGSFKRLTELVRKLKIMNHRRHSIRRS